MGSPKFASPLAAGDAGGGFALFGFDQLGAVDELAVVGGDVARDVAIGEGIAVHDRQRRGAVADPNFVSLGLAVELVGADQAGLGVGRHQAVVHVGGVHGASQQGFVVAKRRGRLALAV